MNAIVYVNTPLEAPEHAALAALARREGRAKGQQLRLLALQSMRGKGGVDLADAGSGSGEKKGAAAAASRGGDRGAAGGDLASAGSALGMMPTDRAADAPPRRSTRPSMSKVQTRAREKGGRA